MSEHVRDAREHFSRLISWPVKLALQRRSTRRVLAGLNASQWQSPEELKALQWRLLTRLLVHCEQHVPHYRDAFREQRVHAADIRSWNDVKNLPILEKHIIRDDFSRLRAENVRGPVVTSRTSGSTGEPFVMKLPQHALAYHEANSIRGRQWWGIEPGDSLLQFWGRAVDFARTAGDVRTARTRLLRDAFMNITTIHPFDLNEERMVWIVSELVRRRPRLLFGYGVALYLVAKYIDEAGVNLPAHCPEVVIYTSETLFESQRELMERVYGAPVVCEYGAVECGIIAYECRNRTLHTSDETLFLEQDDRGALLVTHLRNDAFPLLRYRIGDLVELGVERCSCGRGLSSICKFSGRANDLVRRPNGTPVHAELFDYVMRPQTGVARYRVEQFERGALKISVETNSQFDASQITEIQTRLAAYVGSDMRIEIQCVDVIPTVPGTKFRWVVNHMTKAELTT